MPRSAAAWVALLLAASPAGATPGEVRSELAAPPADESGLDEEAAADLLYRLLDRDRSRHGLSPLARDPALEAVARAHSRDMRDRGFVGHVSPASGGPAERLARAGYRAIAHAENVARDDRLDDAESQLMASPGHRRNILSPDVTRVGIGVALACDQDHHTWFVTQLFARPAPVVDPALAAEQVLERIDRARAGRGLDPLRHDPELTAIATAAAADRDASPDSVLDRARGAGVTAGVLWASVQDLPELDDLLLQEGLVGHGPGRIGVGVAPQQAADPPLIRVVLLVGGR
jgi:uncharacterized protein YkwD